MSQSRPLIGITTFRNVKSTDPFRAIDGQSVTYVDAVLAAGGMPILIPLHLQKENLSELLDSLDGVLLPGGGDIDPARYGGTNHDKVYGIDPDRDRVEIDLVQLAVERNTPILAICRGFQVFNVALGGTLWEDVLDQRPDSDKHAYFEGYARTHIGHSVHIPDGSCLAGFIGSHSAKPVNSLHHQGVKAIPERLSITATAEDGLVEGLEIPEHRFALAVQWHPEEFVHTDTETLALFKGFIDEAAL